MMRRLLISMMVAMMSVIVLPISAQDVAKTSIETEQQAVSITVNVSSIHIKNAASMVLEVYNIAGVKVNTQKIDSSDKTIELNNLPKGCYIIKVGKTVRKIYLN